MAITKIDAKTFSKTVEAQFDIVSLKVQLNRLQDQKTQMKSQFEVELARLQDQIDALKADIQAAKAVGVE